MSSWQLQDLMGDQAYWRRRQHGTLAFQTGARPSACDVY